MNRHIVANFDSLVIGCDLDSVIFAYSNNMPIIFLRHKKPIEIIDNNSIIELYNNILFKLSLNSKIPFSNYLSTINIVSQNSIRATTRSNILIEINFNKLYIGDDWQIQGLPPPNGISSNKNLVLDYFNINSGSNESIKKISLADDFIKNIYFYRSKRRKKIWYDCIVESYIENFDQNLFDTSQSYVRLQLLNILKNNNFKGTWDKTNNMFKTINLSSDKREIFPLGKNIYNNFYKNIHFLDKQNLPSLQDISYKKKFYA